MNQSFLEAHVRAMLHEPGSLKVEFIKADGSVRVMNCSLNQDLMPVEEAFKVKEVALVDPAVDKQVSVRIPKAGVINVWDLDNAGWRSIVVDKIQKLNDQAVTHDYV